MRCWSVQLREQCRAEQEMARGGHSDCQLFDAPTGTVFGLATYQSCGWCISPSLSASRARPRRACSVQPESCAARRMPGGGTPVHVRWRRHVGRRHWTLAFAAAIFTAAWLCVVSAWLASQGGARDTRAFTAGAHCVSGSNTCAERSVELVRLTWVRDLARYAVWLSRESAGREGAVKRPFNRQLPTMCLTPHPESPKHTDNHIELALVALLLVVDRQARCRQADRDSCPLSAAPVLSKPEQHSTSASHDEVHAHGMRELLGAVCTL